MEVNDSGIAEFGRLMAQITRDEAEQEYLVPYGSNPPIPVPFSDLETDRGRVRTLLRLLEKGIDPDVILAFAEVAKIGK